MLAQSEIQIGGNASVWEALALIAAVGGTILVGVRMAITLQRARRLAASDQARLDRLEAEVAHLRAVAVRVEELENRLEFTERLLAQPPNTR
ncbi:MAG: hypothetical protein SFV24_05085 [Gemmatimonadales bacterium]|nr:hypothetical protein [Gemmatimonadales bacterium]